MLPVFENSTTRNKTQHPTLDKELIDYKNANILVSNHTLNKASSSIKTLVKLIWKRFESITLKDNRGLAGGNRAIARDFCIPPAC